MNTVEYWAERSTRRVLTAERQSLLVQPEMIRVYDQSLKNVNRLINDTYTRYANKTGLDVSELTQILRGGDKNNFLKDIQRKMKVLGFNIDEVYQPSYLAELTRLEAIKQQIYWEVQKIAPIERGLVEPMYQDVIDKAYQTTRKDIRGVSGALGSFGTINPQLVDEIMQTRWEGGNWSSRIWGNTDKLGNDLKSVIGGGLISGQSLQKTARQLRERYDVGTYNSMRLVRTETNYFRGQAELQSYIDEGIEYYKYQATLDSRTSTLCESAHETVHKISDAVVGENYPPLHSQCRSTTVVVFKDELPAEKAKGNYVINNEKPSKSVIKSDTMEEIELAYEQLRAEGSSTRRDALSPKLAGEGIVLDDLSARSDSWYPKLSDEVKGSIEEYTSGYGQWINQYLRDKTPLEGAADEKYLSNLDSAIDKFGALPETKLYRGITRDFVDKLFGLDYLDYENIYKGGEARGETFSKAEDKTLVDRGFSSTAIDRKEALWFLREDGGALLEINVPKGAKGAYIGKHSGISDQTELLLARDTKYKFNKVLGFAEEFEGYEGASVFRISVDIILD